MLDLRICIRFHASAMIWGQNSVQTGFQPLFDIGFRPNLHLALDLPSWLWFKQWVQTEG